MEHYSIGYSEFININIFTRNVVEWIANNSFNELDTPLPCSFELLISFSYNLCHLCTVLFFTMFSSNCYFNMFVLLRPMTLPCAWLVGLYQFSDNCVSE